MSAAQKRGFQVIDEADAATPDQSSSTADQITKFNTQLLLLSLKALSQRAIVTLGNLMTCGLVASAWVLWRSVLGNPTDLQLVGLGGYAVFVLLIDVVRRRARHPA
jgi:hypothetical protein